MISKCKWYKKYTCCTLIICNLPFFFLFYRDTLIIIKEILCDETLKCNEHVLNKNRSFPTL